MPHWMPFSFYTPLLLLAVVYVPGAVLLALLLGRLGAFWTVFERDYSPLWSVWRAEHNTKTGATSQSLLWNLYRRDTTLATKKTSLLFGLYQTQMAAKGKQVRLFYLPILKAKG